MRRPRCRRFGFSRDFAQFLFPELEEAGDGGRGFLLAPGRAAVGILTANFILDAPELGHCQDSVCGGLRDSADVQVIKLAP